MIVGYDHCGVVAVVRVRLQHRPELVDEAVGDFDGVRIAGPVARMSGVVNIREIDPHQVRLIVFQDLLRLFEHVGIGVTNAVHARPVVGAVVRLEAWKPEELIDLST